MGIELSQNNNFNDTEVLPYFNIDEVAQVQYKVDYWNKDAGLNWN